MSGFIGIRLFICKLISGTTSIKYQELVKIQSQAKKPVYKLTLCFNNESVLHFDQVISKKSSFPVFKTTRRISMESIEFGEDSKNITQGKGEPQCINNVQMEDKTISVIGYREQILEKQAKILFFSCLGKYFFGEYIFSTGFKEIQPVLAKAIFSKYNIAPPDETLSFYIEDDFGSLLCFYDDGFSLFVKYYNAGKSPIHEELARLYKVTIKPVLPSNDDELSSRL